MLFRSVARGGVLAFLNNDLELTPGWLPPMLETLRGAEAPGIVGNVQINPATGLIDHAGVFFGIDGMPRQARKNRKRGPAAAVTEWNAVTAACMLARASVFSEAGGFDESYRNGFEDIDLCVRLRLKGYRHYVANQSRIYHRVSASPGRHVHNPRNSDCFRERWTETTRAWGAREWAPEYLARYRRHWWKFNFGKLMKAAAAVLSDRRGHSLVYRR